MQYICPVNYCTGCGLCVSKCPRKCISMREGFLGHLYPVVDTNRCIDCGLCRKNCPSLIQPLKNLPHIAFAAWAKDEEDYKTSASGGVASVLSQYIIDQGGVVYGCAISPDVDIKHIRIDNKNDLVKLKGSKYVQSRITEVIPSIVTDVSSGRKTLFVGTPCQCAAIKALYNQQPGNLYLVELICHGVPSLSLLREHLHRILPNRNYDNIQFRDGTYVLKVFSQGQQIYDKSIKRYRYREWFLNTFFYGYTFRESCYKCQFAQPKRCSDITIGDFWKVGKRTTNNELPNHPYGCSVILPCTEGGERLICEVSSYLNIFERDVEEAIQGNTQLRSPVQLGTRIRFFRKYYSFLGYRLYYLLNVDNLIREQYKCLKRYSKTLFKSKI